MAWFWYWLEEPKEIPLIEPIQHILDDSIRVLLIILHKWIGMRYNKMFFFRPPAIHLVIWSNIILVKNKEVLVNSITCVELPNQTTAIADWPTYHSFKNEKNIFEFKKIRR